MLIIPPLLVDLREKKKKEMKLCSSLLSFCMAHVLDELCKWADEQKKEEFER
jgi:hypothetical protein